jgi:hypothetical protein
MLEKAAPLNPRQEVTARAVFKPATFQPSLPATRLKLSLATWNLYRVQVEIPPYSDA